MKKRSRISFGIIAATTAAAFAFAGTTAGTIAWYAFSRSVRVNFVGTSVAKSALLNVGIVDDYHYLSDETIARYELSREEFDGHSIVFTHKTDGIDYHVIQSYLFRSEYAVNLLFPLTTQARSISDTSGLTLYESPVYGETYFATPAATSHYVKIPFAFRMDDGNGGSIYDKDIWLTSADSQATGEHIDESLRVFIENSQRKFLMKPADKNTTPGSTKVGGILDLDGDGTYDYSLSNHEELYYGQYTGSLVHDENIYGVAKDLAPYDNVNGVTNTVESTFYSKHNEDAKVVDLNQISPKVCEYQPFGAVKPSLDSSGNYYEGATGIKIATTDSSDGVGYVTFTIYIEGWDHVVIDQASNYSFNLSLKFETNR